MRICLDMRTGAGCGTENLNHARDCSKCGKPLRFALTLHDPKTQVGRYRVVRVIGYGAYGAVYEAIEWDQRQTSPLTRFFSRYLLSNAQPDDSAQRVALKETFDASSISSFAREFSVLSHLQHPNLPRYIDMFEVEGNGYLVMEYVAGQSLQEILDDQTDLLPESQVLGYALQLCDVLSYLHSQQPPILHRDIKPANIRLTPEGRIKLVDFGLLKQAGYQTRATIRGLGTPAYAPIEQYADEQQVTDVRSDIYSLGATLYHLLSGQEPLSAPNRLAGDSEPLPPLPVTGSSNVKKTVMKAMNLMPKARFASISQFAEALAGLPVAQTAVSQQADEVRDENENQNEVLIETPLLPPTSASHYFENLGAGWTKNRIRYHRPTKVPAPHGLGLPHQICKAGGEIKRLAFTASGEQLIGATKEGQIYLWRASDGYLLKFLSLFKAGELHSFALSPNGQTMATTTTEDLIVRLWQTSDGRLVHQLYGHSKPITKLAYTPDGQILASADKTSVRFWRVTDGKFLEAYKKLDAVVSLEISPDGKLIAIGCTEGNRGIQLWRLEDGKRLRTLTGSYYHERLAWSPDGQLLAADSSRNLAIWHREGHDLKLLKGHESKINSMAWHPTGEMIATASRDATIRLWSLDEPSLLYVCTGHALGVTQVVISPDGATLASGGRDSTVRLWELPKEHPAVVRTRKYPDTEQIALSDRENRESFLASASQFLTGLIGSTGTTHIPASDYQSLPHIKCQLGGTIIALAYSADGETIISASSENQLYYLRARDGQLLKSLSLPGAPALESVAFSPTGETYATAGEDMIIRIWHESGHLLYELREHNALIKCLAYSPDGQTLASAGSEDDSVCIWRMADGSLLHRFSGQHSLESVAYSPDGRMLAIGSRDGGEDIQLRLLATGKKLSPKFEGYYNVSTLGWSPNGQLLASGQSGEVILWRTIDGQQIKELEEHSSRVSSITFNPDGQTMASGSWDKNVCLYFLDDLELLHRCQGHEKEVTCLAYSPNRRVLASGGKDGTVRLWQLPKISPQLVREKQRIAKAWHGLAWGASLADFYTNFPKGSRKNNQWWVTGLETEDFCGLSIEAQYSFNKKHQFYLVVFYPNSEEQERVVAAATAQLGPPDGTAAKWSIGDVEVEVKMNGIMVTITHQKLVQQ